VVEESGRYQRHLAPEVPPPNPAREENGGSTTIEILPLASARSDRFGMTTEAPPVTAISVSKLRILSYEDLSRYV